MPFPLSYGGKITCNPVSGATAIAGRLAEVLRGAGLGNVYFVGDTVVFGGQQDKEKKSYLGMVAGGELTISNAGGRFVVSYRLRFKGLLLVTVATAVLGIGLFDMTRGSPRLPGISFAFAAITILVVTANYIQTVFDFASLIRRALRGV